MGGAEETILRTRSMARKGNTGWKESLPSSDTRQDCRPPVKRIRRLGALPFGMGIGTHAGKLEHYFNVLLCPKK